MHNLKLSLVTCLLFAISPLLSAKAIIDADVRKAIPAASKPAQQNTAQTSATSSAKSSVRQASTRESSHATPSVSLLVFANNPAAKANMLESLRKIAGITIQDMDFMPAVIIQAPQNNDILEQIANIPDTAQISSYKAAAVELDVTAQALKLTPSPYYPRVNNWWAHGYTGKKGVLGLIDTGIDPTHPALSGKKLIVRQEKGSGYTNHLNGVSAPHGTGVACIYGAMNEKYRGIAYGLPTIVSGPAGAETADTSSIMMTMGTVDWMLNRAEEMPTVINYSMGNGPLACPDCPEWSGLAKVIDYVVNTQKILWVKSAGNKGYIEPALRAPFASTLTVPGDNYNGLTIANMNTVITEDGEHYKTPWRKKHLIKESSSRGPTPFGRRKPDLTAPGHDTRTCAPDPTAYGITYSPAMDYKDGYRLMGGTSSAAPHVGGAILLLQDAGITDPVAIKALLINSADTWTDKGTARSGHGKVMGSHWSRTYGWGYLNMNKAYRQRKNIQQGTLTLEKPVWEYETQLKRGEKITLVHERRVGYTPQGNIWKLSHVALDIINLETRKILDSDDSAIDTVHQVSWCKRDPEGTKCTVSKKPVRVLVRVRLLSNTLDGSVDEPFAIVVPKKK